MTEASSTDRGVVALDEAPQARLDGRRGLAARLRPSRRGSVERTAAATIRSSVTSVAGEGLDDVAARHHDHPVAETLELLGVGGGDDDRDAGADDLAQDAVDLGAGPDVDALGRLVRDEDAPAPRAGPGPSRPSAGCRPDSEDTSASSDGALTRGTSSSAPHGSTSRRRLRRRAAARTAAARRPRRSPAPTSVIIRPSRCRSAGM